MLDALAGMDRRMGVTDLLLWVLEDNHDAQCAYKALGFEPTGERQLLEEFGRFELRLCLRIRDLPEAEAITLLTRGNQRSSEPDLRPGLEVQEIQGLPGAAHDVNAAAERLPVG